jgi:hypothetical protein
MTAHSPQSSDTEGAALPAIRPPGFSDLEVCRDLVRDRRNLTAAEAQMVWKAAAGTVVCLKEDGMKESAAKVLVTQWLWREKLLLSKTPGAFVRNLERKLQAGSFGDRRPYANALKRAPKLSKDDLDLLVFTALNKGHHGSVDAAWEELAKGAKLSVELLKRYPLPKRRRPRCPKSIRSQVQPELRRLWDANNRPRFAKLNGAYIDRDWSGVFAGDWYESDDITLPVYWYVPDGKGWFALTRGQFLPMVDCRSKKILDFILIPAKSYAAFHIRSLINHVCSRADYGQPRQGFHFECGIWKTAKLVGNGPPTDDELKEHFASRLGLKISHALPGNAKSKIVENISGLLQNLMAGEPGYVGRSEMDVKYEHVQKAKLAVERGRDNGVADSSGQTWHTRRILLL